MSPPVAVTPSSGALVSKVAPWFTTEALRLEELLASHGVAARVGEASVSPGAMRFSLQLGLGATVRRVLRLSGQLAREAGYSHCRLHREGRTLFLELPYGESGPLYGDLLATTEPALAHGALLGLCDTGATLTLQMTDPGERHLLVTGGAGAGTAQVVRLLALGVASQHAARHWRLALLGSHQDSALASLSGLPHCWACSKSPEAALGWLVRLFNALREREEEQVQTPRVLAVVEHVDLVLKAGGEIAVRILQQLLERGAAAGIHLALTSPQSGSLSQLLPLIPVHLEADGEAKGRFWLHGKGVQTPVLAARLHDNEATTIVERIRASRPRLIARPVEGAL